MSDHKFEQQVRQKLGDLKLTPTAKAWESIENELRHSKRRRSPLIWLPVLLLGLGAAGYFAWKPTANSFGDHPVVTQKTAHDPAINNKEVTSNPEIIDNNTTLDRQQNGQYPITNKKANDLDDVDSGNKSIPGIPKPMAPVYNTSTRNHRGPKKSNDVHSTDRLPSGQERSQQQPANSKNLPDHNNPSFSPGVERDNPATVNSTLAESEPQQSPITDAKDIAEVSKPDTEATTVTPQVGETTNQLGDSNSTASTKKNKTATKKKFSFGVAASTGVSAVNEGKFVNFGVPQVEDVAMLPAPPLYAPAAPSVAPPPSKIYPGFSYSAGLVVTREMSRRLSISAGVNYLQMNTRTEVGYRIDASGIPNRSSNLNAQLGLYYLPGSGSTTTEYRNKYHFIEIPVNLHLLINHSSKLPLYWNAGVSASRLLSSNSLHYDGLTNVYYQNDDLLNKVQGTVMTGFSVSVLNRSKHPLWIGPSARYSISPLLKKDISSRKNFMGLGLDLRWYLK